MKYFLCNCMVLQFYCSGVLGYKGAQRPRLFALIKPEYHAQPQDIVVAWSLNGSFPSSPLEVVLKLSQIWDKDCNILPSIVPYTAS